MYLTLYQTLLIPLSHVVEQENMWQGGHLSFPPFLCLRGSFLAALSVKHLNMNLSKKLPITVTFSPFFPIHYKAIGQCDTTKEGAAQTLSIFSARHGHLLQYIQ